MPLKYETVIFDMDGTLVDSDRGVLGSMQYALERLGHPLPPRGEWRKFLGPPLRFSFKTVAGLADEHLEEAVTVYREYYRQHGVLEADLYPGMQDLLQRLQAAGAKICLATSKMEVMALRILEHQDIKRFFHFCVGSDGGEADSSKQEKIARVLRQTGTAPERAVMIGDTRFDAEGARGNNMPFIGVLFGYGSQKEMEEAGAYPSIFVKDVEALGRELLG